MATRDDTRPTPGPSTVEPAPHAFVPEPVPALPVGSYRDAAPYLRRPFTPAAVKWKVQTIHKSGVSALIVGHIDARLVIERLNLVCPHLWHDAYRPIGGQQMWCDLTVDGITRSDIGEGAGKALVSDALKRAAVHFGVGVSLYATPAQTLAKPLIETWQKGDKWNGKLTALGEKELAARYSKWLESVGVRAFGEPLDHGDVEGAQGDHEAAEPVAVPENAPAPAPSVPMVGQPGAAQLGDQLARYLAVDGDLTELHAKAAELGGILRIPDGQPPAWHELTRTVGLALYAWLQDETERLAAFREAITAA